MVPRAKLLFLCGKMAAGKTTLAKQLAEREDAVLLVEDELLAPLYPGDIVSIGDYVKFSGRLKHALGPHIRTLLARGVSVVLDFPANTKEQRAWFPIPIHPPPFRPSLSLPVPRQCRASGAPRLRSPERARAK